VVAAIALQTNDANEQQSPTSSRGEVLARYRHLREISKQHHSQAMHSLSKDAILQHARRLGLARGRTLVLDSMDELTFAFDLAIYTAPAGRSRAIERYARSAKFAVGSDEALVLETMCNAHFTLAIVQCRHQAAGLIVKDLLRNVEVWLVDEGLEKSLSAGSIFATRYYTPDRFSVTAGVVVPLGSDVFMSALEACPQLSRKSPIEALEDRRFAEALYRVAIADGIAESVIYQETPAPMIQTDT
jgi:hypothetical protein